MTNNPRFLHPKEAAHLLGFPSTVIFPRDVRASLSFLGLSASPLQMPWICSTLRSNVSMALRQTPIPSPEEWSLRYCHEVILHSQPLFDTHAASCPQLLRIRDGDGSEVLLVSPFATTASQLLKAHRIALEWNETFGLFCEGQPVPINAVLTSDTYELSRGTGLLLRPPPPERFVISLTHAQAHHIVFVQGGQILFEALADIGAYFVKFLVDDTGKVYGADFGTHRGLDDRQNLVYPAESHPLPAKPQLLSGSSMCCSSATSEIFGSMPPCFASALPVAIGLYWPEAFWIHTSLGLPVWSP